MADQPFQTTARSRRCYHRVMSGLERGGFLRFLTLTSGPDSPPDCQRDFRRLYMRLQRLGLIKGYIRVPEYTKKGKQHLHIIFRGSYIEQALISSLWYKLHNAPMVDIRAVKPLKGNSPIASEMAKYMCKSNAGRYSWNWPWVWKGFCKDWKHLKQLWRYLEASGEYHSFQELLTWWRWWLKGLWVPPFGLMPAAP